MADPKLRLIVPSSSYDTYLFSNLPEADYANWATATAYAVGDRAIITASAHVDTHWVIECVQAHTSSNATTGTVNRPDYDIDPTSGAGSFWIRVGSTNRFKPMDGIVNDRAVNASGAINTWFQITQPATSVAFLNVVANTANVIVYDASSGLNTINLTKSCIETGGIIDWWTYFYLPTTYKSAVLFPQTPAYSGNVIKTSVDGLTQNELGEVVFGIDYDIGLALIPLKVGITDYSTNERDTFGNPYIVKRAFAKKRTFNAAIDAVDIDRIDSLLSSVRSTPVIFYISDVDEGFSALIYGTFKEYTIDVSSHVQAFLTIDIDGMI